MELSFKIVLDKRIQKKNFTYPLKLRVYQNRDYKSCSLNMDILEDDWDEQRQQVSSSNANHKLYNTKLSSIKTKVQKCILFNEDEEKVTSADEIIRIVNRKEQRKVVVIKPDIIKYGKEQVIKLKAGGYIGNSIVYSCAINKLKAYANADKLTFEEVDYSFVEDFNTALLAEGMKVNGISNYLRTIRAIFNKAIKEGIISVDCYPFNKFKIKNEKTINRTLTTEEMVDIVNLNLSTRSTIWHHRNLFLLSYCLIGINFADLLTLKNENFVDDRVVFRRKKTHKIYSILLHPKGKEIFSHYRNNTNNSSFVLPFIQDKNDPMILKKDILQAIKNTNDYLSRVSSMCKIDKPITTYYARYSWANIAKGLGYSKDLIAEALGHEYGNKVTGIYLDNYSNSVIDEMNAKVIQATFS